MILCLYCHKRPIRARGRCSTCYVQYRKSADFVPDILPRGLRCSVCGDKVMARGLCNKHYMREYRCGFVRSP